MGKKTDEARAELDWFLFRNVHNAFVSDEDKWDITFEGDNYVVWNKETNKLYHFEVKIKPKAWDSLQARENQEWEI